MLSNFIQHIIEQDIKEGKKVKFRFPPEPNGFLHIGHAKSICLNFGFALQYKSICNLRFDDTNPASETLEYVEAIESDIKWLGFDTDNNLYFASDYFDNFYNYAIYLIKNGFAYVCELSVDEIKEYRGTLTEAGKESPYRKRSVEENLDLFERMKKGEFPDGSAVLRLKIDMSSPNLNLRDPAIYRIKNMPHYRTGDKWHIYPMYDFAHSISDSIENITHSLCTLEFEDHRPLYDWILDTLDVESHPRQIEFARMNLSYTVLSKRKLKELVANGYVSGWDDPRMPTIAGLRRRGVTADSIKNFCEKIGLSKKESIVDIALLEHCIREDLNKKAMRMMGVINPVKLVIDNYPEDEVEYMTFLNNPEDEKMGNREVPFSKYLYIEKEDFREQAFKKYFRLAPGKEVRLRYAYYVTCKDFVKDEITDEITEIHCTYDPATKGGSSPDGRKVKGTIHWVSASHAVDAVVNLYDRLFLEPNPEEDNTKDFKDNINPNSLIKLNSCKLEPFLKDAEPEDIYQFERIGYFCVDKDSSENHLIFNRTVTLKDTWANIEKKQIDS